MSNTQKYPPLKALTEMVNNLIEDRLDIKGKQLPCYVTDVDNQFVTVHFDMLPDGIVYPEITIPIMGWEYIRIPIQKGDKGVTLAADVSLRNISKQVGVANRSILPSLTPLFFVPIANTQWSKEDGKKVVIVGPEGAIIKTKDAKDIITVDSDKIELKSGSSTTVTVNENQVEVKKGNSTLLVSGDEINITASTISLNGNIQLNGAVSTVSGEAVNVTSDLNIKDINFTSHTHSVSGVESGSSTVESGTPK